jgi:hypothetical protein
MTTTTTTMKSGAAVEFPFLVRARSRSLLRSLCSLFRGGRTEEDEEEEEEEEEEPPH